MKVSPSSVSTQTAWFEANQRYLMAEVSKIRQALERKVAEAAAQTPSTPPELLSERHEQNLESASKVDTLCQRFGLSKFERQLLLLCAGTELSRAFAPLCAALHGNPQQAYPTFGLAFSLFPEGAWAAITPEAPLRRWRMLEVMAGAELTHSPLRIDEHILHYLMGIPSSDSRLQGIFQVLPHSLRAPLPESHQQIAEQIAINSLALGSQTPVIQLWGVDGTTKRAIATAAATQSGLSLHVIDAEILPSDHSQINLLQCLWERESILAQSALLIDCDYLPTVAASEGIPLTTVVARLIETCQRPLIVTSLDRLPQRRRPLSSIEVHPPTPWEQRQLWQTHLGDTACELNGYIDQLVTYFNLNAPGIRAVCERVKREDTETLKTGTGESSDGQNGAGERGKGKGKIQDLLWQTCLSQARPKLGELAQQIQSAVSWEDLVLPETEFQILKTLAAHVRQRHIVYERWGFASKGQRGLGISALFAGTSGTGKTLAAETLANALHLDLYRIDLSTVVSKYIGETEKNLRRIFDGAEMGGAILLFDEADALFGKRSDIKDAHDRYANMEVAYLLQRIEAYRGLAILTTNLKDSLDQAFLRRIRFVVQFPFPDASQRERIWQRSFPRQTPLGELNFKTLAKLNIAGGNIRNIALNAAFLAADKGEEVGMEHIIKAAQSEYIKLERPLTELKDREIKSCLSSSF